MSIQLTVRPALEKSLTKLHAQLDRMAQTEIAFKKAGILLERWVLLNFKTEGGKVGGWAPFKYGGRIGAKKSSSANSRKRVDTSAKLLQDTGTLRQSFHSFYNKMNAGIRSGKNIDYARAHEEGWGPLPQRRMLPNKRLDPALMKDIRKALEDHVNKATKT